VLVVLFLILLLLSLMMATVVVMAHSHPGPYRGSCQACRMAAVLNACALPAIPALAVALAPPTVLSSPAVRTTDVWPPARATRGPPTV
jgi:hypothetical protein